RPGSCCHRRTTWRDLMSTTIPAPAGPAPAGPAVAGPSPVGRAPVPITGPPVGEPPKPRVLLIDDDTSLLEGLKRRLRSRLDVTTASSGAEALERTEPARPFAVVVSDMRMPGMDGATVLRELRRRAPDTVRVLLTGYVDVDNAIA